MSNDRMEADIRKHKPLREDVRSGLTTLLTRARQIWGEGGGLTAAQIAKLLAINVCDLAMAVREDDTLELKRELGSIVFSTIRWINELGLDPLECLDLAIEAQEKANGRTL